MLVLFMLRQKPMYTYEMARGIDRQPTANQPITRFT